MSFFLFSSKKTNFFGKDTAIFSVKTDFSQNRRRSFASLTPSTLCFSSSSLPYFEPRWWIILPFFRIVFILVLKNRGDFAIKRPRASRKKHDALGLFRSRSEKRFCADPCGRMNRSELPQPDAKAPNETVPGKRKVLMKQNALNQRARLPERRRVLVVHGALFSIRVKNVASIFGAERMPQSENLKNYSLVTKTKNPCQSPEVNSTRIKKIHHKKAYPQKTSCKTKKDVL